MKKSFLTAILLLQSIALLPVLAPTTHKKVHGAILKDTAVSYIIGGEITNTDTSLGIFKIQPGKQTFLIEYHSKNKDIADIYHHVQTVLQDLHEKHGITVSSACFAIPGIAKGDLFLHPHLPWSTSDDREKPADKSLNGLSKKKFLEKDGLEKVYFINDFQAVALGTQLLDSSSLHTLQAGKSHPQKPKLVIGAGNGLGASLLLWDNQLNRYVPQQLNYSFTEFGAQSDLELAFFNYMKDQTGNIAWGKVLGAGAGGIKLIYKFFDAHDAQKEQEDKKYTLEKFVDYPHYLDIFTNRKVSPRCKDSVDFFVNAYARIIRNAAYAQAAYGGVYIANTVAQEFPELFATEAFIKNIVDLSGKVLDEGSRKYLEGYLAELPFYVVTDTKVQLYGAAALCLEPNLIRN
ncbi:glucokinase [Candidatus Babeliales bacterium]|nr:glucokinase [Candidatus Babeliales bacterium]